MESKITRYFWMLVTLVLLAAGAWHGLCALVGQQLVYDSARAVATAGVYTVRYTCVVGIPALGCIVVLSVFGGPLAVIARFRGYSRERLAKRRMNEARAVAIAMDAQGRYRQTRFTTATGQHVVAIDMESGQQQQYHALPKSMLLQQQEEAQDGPKHTAIDMIKLIDDRMRGTKNAPRFIFAGPTRSGKTFMAQRVTEIIAAEYYALDPKEEDPEEPWPNNVSVIGQGDNWPDMERFFQWVFVEREKRAQVMQSNPAAFKRLPKIVIFVEELLTTLQGDSRFSEYYIRILTKFAQFGIGVIPITHSTTATAMGFPKGYAQLIDCFDAVFRFDYDIMTDTRESYVTIRGKDEQPLLPYRHQGSVGRTGAAAQQRRESDFGGDSEGCATCAGAPVRLEYTPGKTFEESINPRLTDFYESKEEKIICELARAGESNRKIAESLQWTPNGRNSKKIHGIKSKYGIGAGS